MDSDLTLEKLRGVLDRFETERLVGDVNQLLRFGESNFRAMQMLRDGGIVAVPDRATAERLLNVADPGSNTSMAGAFVGVRVAILPWLPSGSVFVVSREIWEDRQANRAKIGSPPEPLL